MHVLSDGTRVWPGWKGIKRGCPLDGVQCVFGMVVECGLTFTSASGNGFVFELESALKVETVFPSSEYLNREWL